VVSKTVVDAIGMTASLRAEERGLLEGVGSIKAIVIVVLVLLAGVLDSVRCSGIVDAMLSDVKGNLRRGDSCNPFNLFWGRSHNSQPHIQIRLLALVTLVRVLMVIIT
jgi:hypothetical protein